MKIIITMVSLTLLCAITGKARALDISASAGNGSYQWTDSDSRDFFLDGNTFNVKVRVGLTKHIGLGYSYTSWNTKSNALPELDYKWQSNSLTADYTFSKLLIFTPYVGAGISTYKNDISGNLKLSDGSVYAVNESNTCNGFTYLGGISVRLLRGLYIDWGVSSHYIFKGGNLTKDRQMTETHYGLSFRIY